MEIFSNLSISDYIAIIGIIVGVIGIIVGIIGVKCLTVANKIKNIANEDENSTIQQAQVMPVNRGLNSADAVDLAPKTKKTEIEKRPLITNKELSEMMQDALESLPVEIEASKYLALSEEEKKSVFYIIIPDK
ncbi:MAG: hypothetical protein FWE27_03630 [Defluviitaleaceae bacterium]|nr:hypothetical protein [Defluviitaleaceae bacterium]